MKALRSVDVLASSYEGVFPADQARRIARTVRRQVVCARRSIPAPRRPVTRSQRRILEHALGLDRSATAYRNRYTTGPLCDNWSEVLDLVDRGFMEAGSAAGAFHTFHVTDAGRRELGEAGGAS